MNTASTGRVVSAALLAFVLGSCQRRPPQAPSPRTSNAATLTLGRALFFDTTLSASGRTACSSCHDPRHDWGPPNARPVQLAGAAGNAPGDRAVPSLKYAQDTPPFTEHFREDDGNDSDDLGPTGGRTWDGRVSSAHEQAALPLLSTFEMANASRGAVLARLRQSPTASKFRGALGLHIFDDSVAAWKGLLAALETFQESPEEFYPYTSKYDAFLRGETQLSARERRGLALFNDPAKGNCAQCHPSAMVRGASPQFTDRGFIALGVPRNVKIPANATPSYFDLGLCGPLRVDLANHKEYCGMFKTPSLRNVSRRAVFFHNGVFSRLEDVLRFYAQRDVHPERFYPRDAAGVVNKFDDLPAVYRANVNVDPPFDRHAGDEPAFSDAEAADIIAFLRTLDDGSRPTNDRPSARLTRRIIHRSAWRSPAQTEGRPDWMAPFMEPFVRTIDSAKK
ncbi:MAG: cytochrome c peroxidase [Gemmatimonadaceae bacterium]